MITAITEAVGIKMEKKVQDCTRYINIVGAPELFMWMRTLATQRDPHHTLSDIPELRTAGQQTNFCDVYNDFVEHYKTLGITDSSDAPTRWQHKGVNWMNRINE